MLGISIPSFYILMAKVAATVLVLGSVVGYIWYLRSENGTLTAQKLLLATQLSVAEDANQADQKTISKLHTEAKENSETTAKQVAQSNEEDRTNDAAKQAQSKEAGANEHVSPYLDALGDRLRSIQSTEGTRQN